jgi:DNA-binding NarL/FixJ family response regulator
MTRVFLADPIVLDRFALRLFLKDLKMEVVGEAADWSTVLTLAPIRHTDILLVDWNLLPSPINVALEEIRAASSPALVIVILSYQNAHEQIALSAGANAYISKREMSNQIIERLRVAATRIPIERKEELGVIDFRRGTISYD